MIKKTIIASAIVSLLMACSAQSPSLIKSEGSAFGKHGVIKVETQTKSGHLVNINVLKQQENKVLSAAVFTDMKDSMIEQNTVEVDGISGATVTSGAFKKAVQASLDSAHVTLAPSTNKVVKKKKVLKAVQNFDVVVIGAGGAGFSAAITAKNAGANVVIIEKMPTVGGNSLLSGGEMDVPNNWIQKKQGIKDSIDLYVKDTLKGGDYLGDPEMVRIMAEEALPAAKWLRDYIKVDFYKNELYQFGGHSVKRAIIPRHHTGAEWISKFLKKTKELQIPIHTRTTATALIQDKNGRVIGVEAENNGHKITYNAKDGVIIATGGFAANVKMRTKYDPKLDSRYGTTNSPGITGDGIIMGEKVDAQLHNMKYIQTYPICHIDSGFISLIADARFFGAILVNKEGHRFVEELGRRDVISNAILSQTGKRTYVLWGSEIESVAKMMSVHNDEYQELHNKGMMYKANSIEELANKFGINKDELLAQVARVNEYSKTGDDKEFHYRAGLKPIMKAPFYMLVAAPAVHHTMGGLMTDKHTHVLNKQGHVIKGLYAAGEVTGMIHGSNRLGGNAITDITVFGRIAGKEAAAAK